MPKVLNETKTAIDNNDNSNFDSDPDGSQSLKFDLKLL